MTCLSRKTSPDRSSRQDDGRSSRRLSARQRTGNDDIPVTSTGSCSTLSPMSSPGRPFIYPVLVPSAPAVVMQSLLGLSARRNYFDGYEVRQVTANSLHITRRYVPVWAIIVAIVGAFFFLIGLVALLVRRRKYSPSPSTSKKRAPTWISPAWPPLRFHLGEPRHRPPAQRCRAGACAVPGKPRGALPVGSRGGVLTWPRASVLGEHRAGSGNHRQQDLPGVRGTGSRGGQKLQVLRLPLQRRLASALQRLSAVERFGGLLVAVSWGFAPR